MRTFRVLLAAALLVAFQAWWFARETPTEGRLGAIASEIARANVSVRCPSIWRRLIEISSFEGTAHYDADGRPSHAELRHHVCKTFARLTKEGFPDDVSCLDGPPGSCDDWVRAVAEALHVLSHEAWHLAGVLDEAATECYAYQTDARVAAHFGAASHAGDAIARHFLRLGPRHPLPQYRPSSDCRSGGPQDLRPDTTSWPSS